MISCTGFISMCSEFFKFLEKKGGGYDAVLKYWYHISDTSLRGLTDPHSMVSFCEKYDGYDGAKKYWGHTTSEKACDTYLDFDQVKRYSSRGSEAHCSSVLYEKGNKPTGNYTEPGEGRVVGRMKCEGKMYLHRDFHLLGDNVLKYCGDVCGDDAVIEFLTDYAKTFFAPQIDEIK